MGARYLCRVEEVKEGETQHGEEMWTLKLLVVEGEYLGRVIFDNMPFSKAALQRVKFICTHLGLDVSEESELVSSKLLGRTAYVTVKRDFYVDRKGRERTGASVP